MDRTIAVGVAVFVAVLALSGCRQTGGPPLASAENRPLARTVQASATTNMPQKSSGPVTGHLKTRDKLITIRAGSNGPLYTVESEDGTVLAVDLPAEDVSAKFPELKDVVERGVADWAGIYPQYQTIESPIEHGASQTY